MTGRGPRSSTPSPFSDRSCTSIHPQKAVNPDWQDLDLVPFEDVIRREIGHIVREEEIETVPAVIEASLAERAATRERVLAARERHVFNIGSSAKVAADYLAALARRDRMPVSAEVDVRSSRARAD